MVLEVKNIGISKDPVKNVIIRTFRSRVEVINQKLNDIFEWKALKEIRDELKEEKKVLIELMDGSELHVFEYIDPCMHKIDYSYHWQDKEKRLITRWDNAPHHSEIPMHITYY